MILSYEVLEEGGFSYGGRDGSSGCLRVWGWGRGVVWRGRFLREFLGVKGILFFVLRGVYTVYIIVKNYRIEDL